MSQRINRCSHCGCDEPIHNDIDGKLYCNNCGMSLEKLEGGLTMTNADAIRSMDDKKLADFIASIIDCWNGLNRNIRRDDDDSI